MTTRPQTLAEMEMDNPSVFKNEVDTTSWVAVKTPERLAAREMERAKFASDLEAAELESEPDNEDWDEEDDA